jgi:hypothetical protein
MYIAAALCLLLLRGWKIGEIDEIARIKGESPDEVNAISAEDEDEDGHAKVVGRKSMVRNCIKWRKV